MKQYKVEITKEALQDMEDIYNYIAIDLLAPDNAMGQYNRIADEILTLDTFPERFRIMDSEPEKRMELRRMLVDNYSVFYTIRDERVIVTDVLYMASDIEARLRGELYSEVKEVELCRIWKRKQRCNYPLTRRRFIMVELQRGC